MIIPDGYAQANFLFSGANAPTGAQVTLGFDVSSFVGTVALAAQTIRDAWTTEVLPYQVDELSYQGVLLKYGPAETGASYFAAAAGAGGDTGAAGPPNCAYLAHKNTNFGGRRGSGRMYIPGTTDAAILDNGTVETGKFGQIQGALNDFWNLLDGSDLHPVLLHGTSAPVPYPIIDFELDQRIATQRRRLRR